MHRSAPESVFETDPAVVHATSTVEDGNMSFLYGEQDDVIQARTAVCQRHGITLDQCAVMRAEHSDRIVEISSKHAGAGAYSTTDTIPCDAFITNTPDVCLFLLTADCLPIALYDPAARVIALIHCGRWSTDRRLAAATVEQLTTTYGTDPALLYASIGPGISKDSYIIHEPSQKDEPAWQPYCTETESGTAIDLVSYNRDQLRASGIRPEHITARAVDTATDPDYFSHYASRLGTKPNGRFATLFMLRA